ncbi:MAG TPA: hypothetical protein VEJ63_07235 [Planctomycetota bacterium]|nr:hypothetical protein [Planctomycetota bacterium]
MNQNYSSANPQSPVPNGKTEIRNPQSALPLWQSISGLTPDNEIMMSPDERDAAIRKLLAEVERRAREEFIRALKAPKGEKTQFWDPIVRVCSVLGISRVQLSRYTQELTGMRAHEVTDRIRAGGLPRQIRQYLEEALKVARSQIEESARTLGPGRESTLIVIHATLRKALKTERAAERGSHFAAQFGFANLSRMNRACKLGLGVSLDDLESRMLYDMVQKFLAEMAASGVKDPEPQKKSESVARQGIRDQMSAARLSEWSKKFIEDLIIEQEYGRKKEATVA